MMESVDEHEARRWLEELAARNMTEGNEYGGPVPLQQLPPGITGVGKEVVVEFHADLADGTRITVTQPLVWKGPEFTVPAGLLQEGQVMRIKTGRNRVRR